MNKAALYANENFPLGVVQALRLRSFDVLTTADAGEAGRAVAEPRLETYAHAESLASWPLHGGRHNEPFPRPCHSDIKKAALFL